VIILTHEEFMKTYRPDGFAYNTITPTDQLGNPVGESTIIPFTEIICDWCNDEIDGDVYFNEESLTNAMCKKCANL